MRIAIERLCRRWPISSLANPTFSATPRAMKCYSYVPVSTLTWAVMDVPALVGAFLAEAGQLLGSE